MLVLTRKSEEKIVIGKDRRIVITILRIQGDKVSIGIEADKDTPIFRYELLLKELEGTGACGLVNKHAISAKELAKSFQDDEKCSLASEGVSLGVHEE